MTAPTIGLVFDLGTSQGQGALAKVLQDFPNKDFRSGVQSAKENQMRFILAAGRLDRANGGILLVMAQDEDNAILGLRAANRRLAGYGVTSTHWIVAGDPGFQQRAVQAAQASDKGTTR
jgi:hypothetical protein